MGDSPVMRLVLCRHAQPAEAALGRVVGSLDPGLSARGLGQARLLAASLAPLPLAALYSSPRRRALETAAVVAAEHGLEPIVLAALAELDFGELEGLPFDEVAGRHPALYAAWMDEPTRVRFPGGEGYADLRERAAQALGAILARHEGGVVAAIAHAGPIRALLASCLLMPEEAIFRLDPRHCAITVVDWLEGTPLVRAVNAAPDTWPLGEGS